MSVQAADSSVASDYFVRRDGLEYAGGHVLLDLWDARGLADPAHVEQVMRAAAAAAGATVLHAYTHRFPPEGGVSSVLVLAESHISIHTWPERGFAAVDIFMCGACNPLDTVPTLTAAFRPAHVQLSEMKRGLVP